MDAPYGKRLHQAARREFRAFWSDYRLWATAATGILAPTLIQMARHGVSSVMNIHETLENAIAGGILSMILTYIVAMRKGAARMDAEARAKRLALQSETDSFRNQLRQARDSVSHLKSEIEELRRPKRTPAEIEHLELTRAGLESLGEYGPPLLRHLFIHDALTFGAYPPPLPPGIDATSTRTILIAAQNQNLVTSQKIMRTGGWEDTFRIAPGMKSALEELLYGPRSDFNSSSTRHT